MSDDRVGSDVFYGALAQWWPLISPVEEYAGEASYIAGLLATHVHAVKAVLELGSGGGHIAHHLGTQFDMTLTDVSVDMLAVSQQLNPSCRHVQGDMRTLRLGEHFDAVLIHDAIDYMITEDDLAAAFATAAVHLRPGGIVVIVPDNTTENFLPDHDVGGVDTPATPNGQGVRFLEWTWDPDPNDTWVQTEYCFVLRELNGSISTAHESHRTGLFPERTWLRLLTDAGLAATRLIESTTEDRQPRTVFVGVAGDAPHTDRNK
jgi:SAM-dependent methyltransferase